MLRRLSRCWMAGRPRGGARGTRGAFVLSEIAFGGSRFAFYRFAALRARMCTKCRGTRVQNSGVLSSYGMFLGVMGMPKPTIADR